MVYVDINTVGSSPRELIKFVGCRFYLSVANRICCVSFNCRVLRSADTEITQKKGRCEQWHFFFEDEDDCLQRRRSLILILTNNSRLVKFPSTTIIAVTDAETMTTEHDTHIL